ncbi:MAG: hypothetical protein FH753_13090 [Firmicutes bacterium]|nr:hypothetical protein [Bacillota bacterium]
MNQAPKNMSSYEILKNVKKGERYRSVEYGKVTADILLSLGYVSRRIGVRSKDADYGGFGMGHVASEPNYKLTFQNNMKWFSHYEINIDSNGWIKIGSNKYDWNLHDGINPSAFRGVNAAGKEGIPCFIKINYGD